MKITTIFRGIGVATALLLASCGSDATGPASDRNSPGTGSSTLLVKADVDASDVPGGFVTDFVVEVRDALGEPVSGATVSISNPNIGVVTLLETGGPGDYEATRNSFPAGDFTLNVVSGTDMVQGIVLGGPGIHAITSPLQNDTVSSLAALTVSWTVPSQARSAEVDTRDWGPALVADAGSLVIPAESNMVNATQRIRVYRYNEVDIAGGLFGSRMRVEVRQAVEPIIVQ